MKVEKIDSLHAFLVRGCAAITIAMGLMAGRSANFLRGSDKHCVVLGHLVVSRTKLSFITSLLRINEVKVYFILLFHG